MTGTHEHDPADFAAQGTHGLPVIPYGAHIRVASAQANDGAKILQLLDIVHPAAKTLVDIARSQEEELNIVVGIGDDQITQIRVGEVPRLTQHRQSRFGQLALIRYSDTQHVNSTVEGGSATVTRVEVTNYRCRCTSSSPMPAAMPPATSSTAAPART